MTTNDQHKGSEDSDTVAAIPSEELMSAIARAWLHLKNKHKTVDIELSATIAEEIQPIINRLKSELECERIRLAACGVVALADTPESASAVRANIAEKYKSASLRDAIRRVGECIELRAKLAALMNGLEIGIELVNANPEALRAVGKAIADQAKEAIGKGQYQHIKRGTFYTEIGRGHLQTEQPLQDMAEVVIYRGEDGALWVRPTAEFDDPERFKRIDFQQDHSREKIAHSLEHDKRANAPTLRQD